MYKFKKFGGEIIEDIEEYTCNLVKNDPSLVVCIGCDSAQRGGWSHYAVAVVFHSPKYRHGAHIVFARVKFPKIRDTFQRLWKEAEILSDIGQTISKCLENTNEYKREDLPEHFTKLVDLHIDFNPNRKYASNQVYEAAIPWLKGLGFNTLAKPGAYAASSAADLLVK